MDPLESAVAEAVQASPVPHASYQVEVSTGEPVAEVGPLRTVMLVTPSTSGAEQGSPSGSGLAPPTAAGRGVRYVLTGLKTDAANLAVRSPAEYPAGEPNLKMTRARQIMKKRIDLSLAEKKYTRLILPDLDPSEAPPTPSEPTPVVLCEPESRGAAKRTFFFVAKPPGEEKPEEEGGEGCVTVPALPDDPAPPATPPPVAETDSAASAGVLKKLARYQLSERYEILPPKSMDDAEEVMHKLRVQNLMLKTELVRQAIEHERQGGQVKRGRKKATTLVSVERLRELEKIEAGMHSLFTPSQVKALARDYKKNSVQWRDEDFRRALGLLEASSVRVFSYVRKEMNIPLPSIGTLKLRCPHQPDLAARLQAVLNDQGNELRCLGCRGRLSSAGGGGGGGDVTFDHESGDWQQPQPAAPVRGIMKKRRRQGQPAARKAARIQEEPVVFFEEPAEALPLGRRGRGRSGRGKARGLVRHYEELVAHEEQDEDEEEDPYEDEEEVEIEPQQEEVPVEFQGYRNSYSGWGDWDPQQLQ